MLSIVQSPRYAGGSRVLSYAALRSRCHPTRTQAQPMRANTGIGAGLRIVGGAGLRIVGGAVMFTSYHNAGFRV